MLDGTLPPEGMLNEIRNHHSPLIAADGAARQLRSLGIAPDVIIGDFDSLGEERFDPFFETSTIIEEPGQERYDGEKCLEWIVSSGYDRVTVLGAGGGMVDHVLNNFSFLAKFADRLRIRIREEDAVGYIVCDALRLETTPGDRISLIPLPEAHLTTTGLHWNLQEEMLKIGASEGGSNRADRDEVEIRLSQGKLVLLHYYSAPV